MKILAQVDINKGVLVTMDGAEYFVNPGDLPTCCTWIPMVELDIITMNGKRYVINKDNGDSIELI